MLQAKGEGEVQYCVLEIQGKVDLIWNNVFDCFLFSGNRLMKIYSKYLFDLSVAPEVSSPRRNDSNYMLEFSRNNKENFVAVLNYNNLLRDNPTKLLNRESLLLLSVLFSADYHIYVIKDWVKREVTN